MWLNHSAGSMTPCELISNFVYWHGHIDGKVKHWFPYSGQLTCMIIHTDIYMYNVTNSWNIPLALKVLKMNYIWQSQLFQRNRGIIRNISSFLNSNLEHSILRKGKFITVLMPTILLPFASWEHGKLRLHTYIQIYGIPVVMVARIWWCFFAWYGHHQNEKKFCLKNCASSTIYFHMYLLFLYLKVNRILCSILIVWPDV